MSKITPSLWFDMNAEQAVAFYAAVFPDSAITNVMRAGEQVISLEFTLNGQDFIALNGGPQFRFTEAVSFFVPCETQAEVDYYWNALSEGGAPGQCGWLKDKFGLSWQIVPTVLGELLGHPDPAKAQAAMQAMMQMQKLDIAALQEAHARG